jgi:hypothetical protein
MPVFHHDRCANCHNKIDLFAPRGHVDIREALRVLRDRGVLDTVRCATPITLDDAHAAIVRYLDGGALTPLRARSVTTRRRGRLIGACRRPRTVFTTKTPKHYAGTFTQTTHDRFIREAHARRRIHQGGVRGHARTQRTRHRRLSGILSEQADRLTPSQRNGRNPQRMARCPAHKFSRNPDCGCLPFRDDSGHLSNREGAVFPRRAHGRTVGAPSPSSSTSKSARTYAKSTAEAACDSRPR